MSVIRGLTGRLSLTEWNWVKVCLKVCFEVVMLNWLQNIYWIDHATLERVYGGLTPLSLRPKEKRLQFAGHFYRADKGSSLILWRAPWVGRVQSSKRWRIVVFGKRSPWKFRPLLWSKDDDDDDDENCNRGRRRECQREGYSLTDLYI